jgi:putative nucleotidyltransferase with HDIG domain
VSDLAERIEAGLAGAPALAAARAGIGADRPAWVVGGAVRNAILGREVTDIDVAVAADAAGVARRIARAAEAHPFELSGEFATWRVTARDGAWALDVAELRGADLDADLRLRDFTLNAIAVPLHGGEAIDPTGGLADLDAATLRAASGRAFADDPLRILRAARIASSLGLAVAEETIELARAEASRAGEPAGERTFAELAALVAGPDPVGGMDLLDRLGATAEILPELEALRGLGQSANHHLDAHQHTIEVLRRALELEGALDEYAGAVAAEVAALMAEPLADGLTRRDALRFAALLHDIGKPATREERGEWVSFIGHDAVGAEMVRDLFRRLRASRRFGEQVAAMTRDHLVLGFMVRDMPLPPRRVWEYLRRTSPQAIDTTLLTVADRLSAKGGGVPDTAIEGHLELAREMLAAAVEWEREGPPEPLLRGDEIAAAAEIEPGPELGEAVRELEAAQFADEVRDRDAAVAHLRAWRASR